MRRSTPPIILSDVDFRIVSRLIKNLADHGNTSLDDLEFELDRATVIPHETVPSDVVTMYSIVEYEDLSSGKVRLLQLTLPEDANIQDDRVSVFAPVGAATLGLRVGQTITWPLPNGKMGQFRIKNVSQRPDVVRKVVG